jgi:dolichol kinase
VFVLFLANAGASLFYKIRVLTRRDMQFLLFFSVAYGLWLLAFSIDRYLVALELLAAPLIVLLLCRFLRALRRKPSQLHRLAWSNVTAVLRRSPLRVGPRLRTGRVARGPIRIGRRFPLLFSLLQPIC